MTSPQPRLRVEDNVLETLKPMAFEVTLPKTLGELHLNEETRAFMTPSPEVPFPYLRDESIKKEVRDSLRVHGYKPTGRGKPASEYLIGAFEKEIFSPTQGINAAVDLCNLVSLHSGLPISVVDRSLLGSELSIKWLPKETRYPFNPSGQLIDASGLVALCDEDGVSGTPVKDSQRTKTNSETVALVTVLWTPNSRVSTGEAVLNWYIERQRLHGWSVERL